MKRPVKITLDKPVVISQASADIRGWGPWQFPKVGRNEHNDIQATFHMLQDSARDYGKQKGQSVSKDGGQTWSELLNIDEPGLLLPDGDRIKAYVGLSRDVKDVRLPAYSMYKLKGYASFFEIYDAAGMDEEFTTPCVLRKKKGCTDWVKEKVDIRISGNTVCQVEGVVPGFIFWRMRVSPEGHIWAITYRWRLMDGYVGQELDPFMRAMFIVSEDGGRNWRYSDIPYQPDPSADEKYLYRGGFTEPDVTFLPDGTVFCLLRTTDGHGIGPSYWCKSYDGGITWSKPQVFDRLGVWPELLTLKNGVTLASYGRRGLFLRATGDPEGQVWDHPVTVVHPQEYQRDTCSYSSLVALGDNSALLVFSDFNWPDDKGIPRKSIMAVKVNTSAE